MPTTGALIRCARQERGLKQTDLARLAGTDRSTASRAETGARQAGTLSRENVYPGRQNLLNPGAVLRCMAKFARALGVTVDSLVGADLYGKGA